MSRECISIGLRRLSGKMTDRSGRTERVGRPTIEGVEYHPVTKPSFARRLMQPMPHASSAKHKAPAVCPKKGQSLG